MLRKEKFKDYDKYMKDVYKIIFRVYFKEIKDVTEDSNFEDISNNISNLPKDILLYLISKEKEVFLFIKNPSKEFCMEAIRYNPEVFKFIKNRDMDIILYAITKNVSNLKYVEDKSDELISFAIKNGYYDCPEGCDPNNYYGPLHFIENPTREMLINCIIENPKALQLIDSVTEDMYLECIKYNFNVIKYVKEPSNEFLLKAVEVNPKVLYHINQTKELCMIALIKDPNYIQYVKLRDVDLYLYALEKDPSTMKYFQDYFAYDVFMSFSDEEIKDLFYKTYSYDGYKLLKYYKGEDIEFLLDAVNKDIRCLNLIKGKPEEFYIKVVSEDGDRIKYINNPSYEVCKAAIKQNACVLRYIEESEELCEIAIKQVPKLFEIVEHKTFNLCKLAIELSIENISEVPYLTLDLYNYAKSLYTFDKIYNYLKFETRYLVDNELFGFNR